MATFNARPNNAIGRRSGELYLNPGSLRITERPERAAELEVVIPYVGEEITAKVMDRAGELAAGLNAILHLVAVYVAPYPTELRFPAAMREHLTKSLSELAERCALPARVDLVVARDREDGFRQVMKPGSAVLLGTRRRWWWTREERLARRFAREGHRVSLLHFD